MEGKALLSTLLRGEYHGLSSDIRNYLKPALITKDEKIIKDRSYFAVKYLYIYTTEFDNIPQAEIQGVFSVIGDCVTAVHNYEIRLKTDLTVEKLLYHILLKAINQGYLAEAIDVAKLLHTCFATGGHGDDPFVPKMAESAYAALWNAALKQEKRVNYNMDLCLRLRHSALHHLLLSNKADGIMKEAVSSTIMRYSRGVKKMKLYMKAEQDTCDTVCDMVQDVGQSIEARLAGVVSDDYCLTFIQAHINSNLLLLNHLCSHGRTDRSNTVINEIKSFLVRTKKLHLSVVQLLCSLAEAGVLLLSYTTDSNNSTGKKRPAIPITQVLELIRKCNESFPSVNQRVVGSLSAVHRLSLSVLELGVCFCLQLQEDGSRSSKSGFDLLPEQVGKEIIMLYQHAAKLFECGQKGLGVSKALREKVVARFLQMEVKVRQYHLQAVLAQLEDLKELNDAPIKNQLSEVPGLLLSLKKRLQLGWSTDQGSRPLDNALQLGNIAYRFGRLCYYRKAYQEAEGFLSTCITQLLAWKAHAPLDKHVTVLVQLWRKHEMLADVQRRLGHPGNAMNTVVNGLMAEPGNLSSAVDMWAKIKVDATKTGLGQIDTTTLWENIDHEKCTFAACEVLAAEMSAYKKISLRTRHHDLLYAVIGQLLEATNLDPVIHARTLLEKAQILWTTRQEYEGSAIECCQEAVKLLEERLANQKSSSPSLLDDLARAYLWSHLVADIDPLQLRDRIEKNKECDKTESASEGHLDDNEAFPGCCTIEMERSALKWVDQALDLWERMARDGGEDLECVTTTLECLSVLSGIYRLTRRVCHECRSLQVFSQLASVHERHTQFLQAQTQLAQLYCRLQQPHLATALVMATQEWLNKLESVCQGPAYVVFLLVRSEAYLLNGQVTESCQSLHQAVTFKDREFKAKSTEALTLDSHISRMTARLLSLPPSYHDNRHDNCCLGNSGCCEENGVQENALEMVVRGARSISGVVCFLMGKWLLSSHVTADKADKVPINTVNKWYLLDDLLTSLLSTGATYIQLGEAREAKCYLDQGLRLAQAFHIPRRFAAFHLELSRLSNLFSIYASSQMHINVVSYILNNDDVSCTTSTVTPLNLSSKDQNDLDMVIKSLPIDIPEELSNDVSNDVIGSPTAQRWRPHSPASWQHGGDCDCDGCSDVTLQGLHLLHLSLHAHLLYGQGLHSQAQAFWHLLLQHFDGITNRAQVMLTQLQNTTSVSSNNRKNDCETNKRQTKKSKLSLSKKKCVDDKNGDSVKRSGSLLKPSMYQRTLLDVCLHVAELSVCQENWTLYQEWITKAAELVDMETYPWMTEAHIQLAKVRYLRMAPSLPWPKVSEKSDLEELCQRIGRVRFSEQEDEPFPAAPPQKKDDVKADVHSPLASIIHVSEGTTSKPGANKAPPAALTTPAGAPPSTKNQTVKNGRSKPSISSTTRRPQSGRSDSSAGQLSEDLAIKTPVVDKPQKVATSKIPTVSTIHTQVRTTRARRNVKEAGCINQEVATPIQKTSQEGFRDAEYLAIFKTPRSVSGRRAMLDLLIDSDEDDKFTVKAANSTSHGTKETASAKPSTQRRGRKKTEVNLLDSGRKTAPSSVLSPSSGNTMNYVPSTLANKEAKFRKDHDLLSTPSQLKYPSASLLRSTISKPHAMDRGCDENVYDFALSSSDDEDRAVLKGKKRPGKPGRKAATRPTRKTTSIKPSDIEIVREGRQADEEKNQLGDNDGTLDTELHLVTEKEITPVVTKKNVKKTSRLDPVNEEQGKLPQPSRRTGRIRLTRARTAVLEGQREDEESDESLSISFEKPEDAEDCDGDFGERIGASPPGPQCHKGSPLCGLEASPVFQPCTSSPCISEISFALGLEDRSVELARTGDQSDEERTTRRKRSARTNKPKTVRLKKEQTKRDPDLDVELPRMISIKGAAGNRASRERTSFEVFQDEDENAVKEQQLPLTDVQSGLEQAFNLMAHYPPVLPYRSICHAMTLLHLAKTKADPWLVAFYLTEAQSVTFRHNALLNINRKLRKLKDENDVDEDVTNQRSRLGHMRSLLNFGRNVEDLRAAVSAIPKGTSVVQVTVLTGMGEDRGQLLITRFDEGEDPATLHLPGFSTQQGQRVLREVDHVMRENLSTMALTNKLEWWTQRQQLDEKLMESLEELESRWVGCWLGVLLGWPDNEEDGARLAQAAESLTKAIKSEAGTTDVHPQLVKVLLRSHHLLDDYKVRQCLCHLLQADADHPALPDLLSRTKMLAKKLNLVVSTRSRPVVLILDKVIQHLPWESTPILRGQPVTRMPSIQFLQALSFFLGDNPESLYNTGVDRRSTFYVLNPDDNLPNTQIAFLESFQNEPGWQGVISRRPTSAEFSKAVTQHDLFIYAGHGCGAKFLPGEAVASLQCHAAVLLMGCSSGKLTVNGQLEGAGMMLNYFLAGCPCIVACLWDVTDRDIDRFLGELLKRWKAASPGTSLVDCVYQSRDVCRMSYLIGAAPVVYGLPVHVKQDSVK